MNIIDLCNGDAIYFLGNMDQSLRDYLNELHFIEPVMVQSPTMSVQYYDSGQRKCKPVEVPTRSIDFRVISGLKLDCSVFLERFSTGCSD
jgi:hypothetical protein